MQKRAHVLLLERKDRYREYQVPDSVELERIEYLAEKPERACDLVIWDRCPDEEESSLLSTVIPTYALYAADDLQLSGAAKQLYERKLGQRLSRDALRNLIEQDSLFFFHETYGEKYIFRALAVSPNFKGAVSWKGSDRLILEGEFGDHLQQTAFWRYNIPIIPEQQLDFWLEYKKTPGVEICLKLAKMREGVIAGIVAQETYTEEQLQEVVHLRGGKSMEVIFAQVLARGSGTLEIIALHDRHSRDRFGHLMIGAERYVTSEREEIFCYFDPADLKPPLNVFFSGYKTREGFEGLRSMQRMGSPFLLIADQRLEGGAFYIGSEEYETLMKTIITGYMERLGFTSDDVIMAGISMGSYGALYYACDLLPHAIVLGKPLVSLGDMAENERKTRISSFATSLDLLLKNFGDVGPDAIDALNRRLWDKFDAARWKNMKIAAAYMIEDDYDPTAYSQLISHIHTDGIRLYGKGLHGRHSDDSIGIVKWFLSQYRAMVREILDVMSRSRI